jgi:KUP system potassium uptake protein
MTTLDLLFLATNLKKIPGGGWFPIVIGALIFALMTTWRRGRDLLNYRLSSRRVSPREFFSDIDVRIPHRQNGTAIFLSRLPGVVPTALFHNVRHNHTLHETVLVVSIDTKEVPTVPDNQRFDVKQLGDGIYQVILAYGYMQEVDLPQALRGLKAIGIDLNPELATYFVSRETVVPTDLEGMAIWREMLFAFMSRNAFRAASFFKIPSNQVVEIGVQVDI